MALEAILSRDDIPADVKETLKRLLAEWTSELLRLKALSENQELLAAVMDNTDEAILLSDTQAKPILFNARFARFVKEHLGFDMKVGFQPHTLLAPEEAQIWEGWHGRALNGETFAVEYTHQPASGASLFFEVSFKPILSGGAVVGFSEVTREITDRKRAEVALRASEERYRRITEAITDYTFTVRVVDGRAVDTHHGRACETVTGYSSEQYAADPYLWLRMVVAEDRALVEEQARRALNGEQTGPIEHRIVRKDGAVRWVRNTVVLHRDAQGALWAYDGVISDVTERKLAQDELREREKQLRALVETTGEWIWAIDRQGRLTYSNPGIQRILGYAPEEILARPVWNLLCPEEREGAEAFLRGRIAAQGGWSGRTLRWRHKDGSTRHLESNAAPVFDPEGRLSGYQGADRDISKRRRAEASLRASEERLRSHIRETADAVFCYEYTPAISVDLAIDVQVDRLYDGVVVDCNLAFARACGEEDTSAVIGKKARDLRSPVRNSLQLARRLVESGYRIVDDERVNVLSDGSACHVLHNAHAIVEEGRLVRVWGTIRDVTERRRLEAQVQHAQKLESLGVLAGGIAHDFNNLLVSVLGNASLARASLPADAGAGAQLRDIETAARRASGLCNQLLAYSGRGTFIVEPLDLNLLIREVLDLVRVSISKKALLSLKLADRATGVKGDATQLRQIVLNLVVNASEALGDQEGTVTVATRTSRVHPNEVGDAGTEERLAAGEYVVLEVTDTGVGMDAETRRRLFDPFFTTKFTGRGLGLSAVLGIVRGHHGAIQVSSELGRGTTVRVLLPRLAEDLPAARSIRPPEAQSWTGKGTVLVVDDDAAVRAVAQRMIERRGFRTLQAADGREGVETFREHHTEIVLVLLDLTMPRLGGEEALRQILAIRRDVPVLLMSGFGECETAHLLMDPPVAGFVQKPFDLAGLGRALQDAVGEGGPTGTGPGPSRLG